MQLNPCIPFSGNARSALESYRDVFGMLTDRFGIGWMVNISPAG